MGDVDINMLTMDQYLELTHGNQASGVVKPKIRGNVNFEIKSQFMRELREDTFSGNKNDDAYEHVERVLDIVSLFNISGVTHDAVMLRVFPITLIEAVKRYCPPSKTAKQLEEIHNFKKEGDETLYQALERRRVSNDSSTGITAIKNKLDNLGRDMKKLKDNMHAIQVGCDKCRGAYLNKECPLHEEVKSVEDVKYGEFGRPLPNNNKNGARYHVGLPGYHTRIMTQIKQLEKDYKAKATNEVPNSSAGQCKAIFANDKALTVKASCNLSEMTILGRPFLATIHAQIDAFHGEISLGVGEDWAIFDMNGKAHHSTTLVEKVYMINKI
nr:hypothetical protein [Tanacetum cinerariifolium]